MRNQPSSYAPEGTLVGGIIDDNHALHESHEPKRTSAVCLNDIYLGPTIERRRNGSISILWINEHEDACTQRYAHDHDTCPAVSYSAHEGEKVEIPLRVSGMVSYVYPYLKGKNFVTELMQGGDG